MSDIKISPCPLCKGEVVDTGARVNYSKMIVTLRLKCTKCGTTTSLTTKFRNNPYVAAIMAWNKSVGGKENE